MAAPKASIGSSTTEQLLLEVQRYAHENMKFNQCGIKAAGRRARKHLAQIMRLAKQRRAEISAAIKASKEVKE